MTRRDASRLLAFGGFGCVWASGCSAAGTQSPTPPESTAETFERILERIRSRHKLPGLAAALMRGNQSVLSGVTGVRRLGAANKFEPDDRFHLASCTKSMTAMLAAVAVHKGLLKWDSTLAAVLPDLAEKIRPAYRSATLEQLLAHAARIPAYTQPNAKQVERMKALKGTSTEQRLAFLAEVLGIEQPNEGTGNEAYSNAGYAAAGAMLERVTNTAWEDLVQRELARPLGMTSVGFGYPATTATPEQPRGHAESGGRIVELPLGDARQLAVCLWPAGAVHCSMSDFARYAADQLNGLQGRRALLPQAMYQRLHRPLDGSQDGFTLGWGIRQDKQWGVTHFGAGSGGWFFARIEIMPASNTAVVAASNSGWAAQATKEVMTELMEKFATRK